MTLFIADKSVAESSRVCTAESSILHPSVSDEDVSGQETSDLLIKGGFLRGAIGRERL